MLTEFKKLGMVTMDLLEVRAKLLARDLEATGKLFVANSVVVLVGAMGFAVLLGGIAVWAARFIGAAEAMAILGAFLIVLAGVTHLVVRWLGKRSTRLTRVELEKRADLLKDRLTGDADTSSDKAEGSMISGLASAAMKSVAEHPDTVASGVFAIASLVGPRRTMRALGKATATASVFASLSRLIDTVQGILSPVNDGHNDNSKGSPEESSVAAAQMTR